MAKNDIRLGYNTIECLRCRATRFRGVRCPDCGRAPDTWEIDEHLLRRRIRLAGLAEQLDAEPSQPLAKSGVMDADVLFDEVDDLHARFFAAVRELVKPDGTGGALHDVITDFLALRDRVRRAQRRRPFLALAQMASEVVSQTEHGIRCWLAALTAETPLEAQRQADAANRHSRLGEEAADRFTNQRDTLERIDFTSTGAMIASMVTLQMEDSRKSIQELIEDAETSVAQLLGIQDGSAVGLQFALAEFVTALEFDPARLRRTFVGAYAVLSQDPQRLADIATASPELVTDFLDGQVTIFNSCWNLRSIIENAQTDRQIAEAALDVQSVAVEGPGAVITRSLLLATGLKQKPYAKLKSGHATEDLQKAQADPRLAPLLEGLNDQLRTARSHQTVRHTDHSIIATTRKGSFEVEHDDLADLVLTGLESVLAGTLALRQALAQAGVDVADDTLSEDLGLPLLELGRISLQMITGYDATVELQTDAELLIKIDGPLQMSMAALVAALGPALDQADRFRFVHTQPGQTEELTGPTRVFRSPTPHAEFDKQLRVVTISTELQHNGSPAITSRQIRKWCANKALEALIAAGNGAVAVATSARQVRSMVALARATSDSELEAALRRCSRWLGLRDNTENVIALLRPWALDDIDWNYP